MTDREPSGSSADRPVFAAGSGRQRRTARRIAMTLTSAIATAGGILVTMLLGAPVVPTALLPSPPANPIAPTTGTPPNNAPTTPATWPTTTAPHTRQTASTRTGTPTLAGTITAPTTSTTPTTAPATTTQAAKLGQPGHGKPTSLPTPPGHSH
jgi:hypothetical protein